MSTIGRLAITSLLALIIVGPLLSVAAGISLVTSLPSLMSSLARQLVSTDKKKLTKIADAVELLSIKREGSSTEQLEILGTTLAALRPVPAFVPSGKNALAYVRDAIVWQFNSDDCTTVVGIKYVTSALWLPNVIAVKGFS